MCVCERKLREKWHTVGRLRGSIRTLLTPDWAKVLHFLQAATSVSAEQQQQQQGAHGGRGGEGSQSSRRAGSQQVGSQQAGSQQEQAGAGGLAPSTVCLLSPKRTMQENESNERELREKN